MGNRTALYIFIVCAVSFLVWDRPARGEEGFADLEYFSPRDLVNKPLKVYRPAAKASPAPLVIHVCGGNFNNVFPREAVDFARRRGWILVKIMGLKGPYGWEVDEFELDRTIEAIRRRFPVDPDRVYLLGLGAWGVLRHAFRRPDRYAAVAASSPFTDFSTYYRRFYAGSTTSSFAPYQRAVLANASTRTLMKNAAHLPTMLV